MQEFYTILLYISACTYMETQTRGNNKYISRRNSNKMKFEIAGNYLTPAQFLRVDLDTVLDAGHISNKLPFAVRLLNQMQSMSVVIHI